MIPGGGATVRWGAKPVIQLGVLGTAASLALMPAAGRLGRPALTLSAVMVFMGLTQGPMSPALGQMSRDWMPSGGGAEQIEKAWSQRFQMLSHTAAPAVAAFLTPRLADRFSWQQVCFVYAGAGAVFSALWQLGVSSKPPRGTAVEDAVAPAAATAPTVVVSEPPKKVMWAMFRLPSVRALMLYHIAYDNMNLSMGMLAPTYFVRKFGITPVRFAVHGSFCVPSVCTSLKQQCLLRRFKCRATCPLRRSREGRAADNNHSLQFNNHSFQQPFISTTIRFNISLHNHLFQHFNNHSFQHLPLPRCALTRRIGAGRHVPFGFLITAIESVLVKRGISALTIRKVRKTGQLQPLTAVFPQECVGQLASFGPT